MNASGHFDTLRLDELFIIHFQANNMLASTVSPSHVANKKAYYRFIFVFRFIMYFVECTVIPF